MWASAWLSGSNLEALTARVSFESDVDGNSLLITGDDHGVTNDEIVVQISSVNSDYVEVLVNGELQFIGLLATVNSITINGMAGIDDVTVDPLVTAAVAVSELHTPHVISVSINSTNPASNDGVYEIPAGNGEQIRTIPVGGANKITITFSEAVTVSQGNLTLYRSRGEMNHDMSGVVFSHIAGSDEATWEFPNPLPNEQFIIRLDGTSIGGVKNGAGALLDGDWINATSINETTWNRDGRVISTFPSGNGLEGGDFEFYFTILPGDANRDNAVGAADSSILFNNWSPAATNKSWTTGDFNGDGAVGAPDSALLFNNWNPAGYSDWPEDEQLVMSIAGNDDECRSRDAGFAALSRWISQQEHDSDGKFMSLRGRWMQAMHRRNEVFPSLMDLDFEPVRPNYG